MIRDAAHGSPRSASRAGRPCAASTTARTAPGPRAPPTPAASPRARPRAPARRRAPRRSARRCCARVDEDLPVALLLAPLGGQRVRRALGDLDADLARPPRTHGLARRLSGATTWMPGAGDHRERLQAELAQPLARQQRRLAHEAKSEPASGSKSKTTRSGRSSRSRRALQTCGVMQFWLASQRSVSASWQSTCSMRAALRRGVSQRSPSRRALGDVRLDHERAGRSPGSSATGSAAGRARRDHRAGHGGVVRPRGRPSPARLGNRTTEEMTVGPAAPYERRHRRPTRHDEQPPRGRSSCRCRRASVARVGRAVPQGIRPPPTGPRSSASRPARDLRARVERPRTRWR